jgi:hypothetical protein
VKRWQTVQFQKEAQQHAAMELIQSYDYKWTADLLKTMIGVMLNDASKAQKMGNTFTVDELRSMFHVVS